MSDDVIQRLFNKIDGLRDDVTFIKATMEEREKRDSDNDHERRIKSLELWKAAHEGISGFIQRWGPVIISGGIAIYVGLRGH